MKDLENRNGMIDPEVTTISNIYDQSLAGLLEDYCSRDAQKNLSVDINKVLRSKGVGVFEAGTGTGKTLGYLVPAFLHKKQVVLSTGTRNLQDQLFLKDIPLLVNFFPKKRISLLKGRSNYLCIHRFKQYSELGSIDQVNPSKAQEIEIWRHRTISGDLTEILDSESLLDLEPLISSTAENCLGTDCGFYNECFLFKARDIASKSDIVIVNHYLLFSHLLMNEEHVRNILPEVSAYIIDEAHKVPGIARKFIGDIISSQNLHQLISDLSTEQSFLGDDDQALTNLIDSLDQTILSLEAELDSKKPDKNFDSLLLFKPFLLRLENNLNSLELRLRLLCERSDALRQLQKRVQSAAETLALFLHDDKESEEYAYWIENKARAFSFHRAPVLLENRLASVIHESKSPWVFTSATLTIEQSFEYFLEETGIQADVERIYPSPFDFESAVRGLVLPDLPWPGSDQHTISLACACMKILRANSGRTFFLFTSHRAMRVAAEIIRGLKKPLFVQGEASKFSLIKGFKENDGSILMGTDSFWEGIDVSGLNLTLLIIDKLPFPVPNDPILKQKSRMIIERDGNPFLEIFLPKALLSLKQGFGRLIRSESDRGLFVLGDPRMATKSYRSYIKKNLPFRIWIESIDEASSWLNEMELK
ncbi:ATP-dependent DNA helicase [Gammaproteobacteria bacterium]|nr:ATP-dependent DNA helicase [Gammaproteobacteria bacterium]